MPAGEIFITCPHCNHRSSIPIAAVHRDNYYCSKCFEKVPLGKVRTASPDTESRSQPVKPKRSSRSHRRF